MNQIRLIMGAILFVAIIIILALGGSAILLGQVKNEPVLIGQRQPLVTLGYCASNQVRPCILSFNLDSRETMIINILSNRSSPNFYLKIKDAQDENNYRCQKVTGFSTNFSCTGKALPAGKELQVLMISKKQDIVLAEGSFPIIGLAIATPEIAATPTPVPPLFNRPPK